MTWDHQRRYRGAKHQVAAAKGKAGKGECGERCQRNAENGHQTGDDHAVDQITGEIELGDGPLVIVQRESDMTGIECIGRLKGHPDRIENRREEQQARCQRQHRENRVFRLHNAPCGR